MEDYPVPSPKLSVVACIENVDRAVCPPFSTLGVPREYSYDAFRMRIVQKSSARSVVVR